jgi:outer membrane protein TolC
MKNLKYLIFLVLTVGSAQAITYDEALVIAFRNNPSLYIADLGIDEADEQLIQTRAGFSPQVKFSGSYTRLNTVPVMNFEVMPGVEFEVPMGAADNYSAGFSITVPLFLGGKRAWAVQVANLGVDAAEEDAIMTRAELHVQVTAAFYGLMLTEEAKKIAAADLARASDRLQETRARWKVGYASPLDLKADEVAVSQARAAQVQAENSNLQAQQFLNMVIGKPVSDPIKAEGDFSIAYQELAADSLVRRALAQRPEISALDRAEQIAGLSRSLSRSAYSPSLVFVASPSWQNPYQQAEGWGSSMAATLALEWPLYDGGKGLSEARAADIQAKKLAYTRSQAEDGIELDVRQAHASWVEANEQVLVQQTLGAQMAELASMAEEQYRMGVISSLDYQSIQLSRTQVDLARLAALYQLILAREKLNAAAWLWDAETLEEFETSKEDLK